MTTDFRALCVELSDALRNAIRVVYHEDGTQHISTAMPILRRARAALADGPAVPEGKDLLNFARNQEPWKTWLHPGGCLESAHCEVADLLSAVLARWGNPAPQPPAEGEVEELVNALKGIAYWRLHGKPGDKPAPFDVRQAARLTRAAELLQRLSPPQPVPVSERLPVGVEQALIKAECALSDIAEGEPEENEGDADALLQWAEQRAATALSRIRPVMRLHGILTSEWPPLPAHALPVPGQEVR